MAHLILARNFYPNVSALMLNPVSADFLMSSPTFPKSLFDLVVNFALPTTYVVPVVCSLPK